MKNTFPHKAKSIVALLLSLLPLYGCVGGHSISSDAQIYGIASDNAGSAGQNCKFVRLDASSGGIAETFFDFGEDGNYPDAAFSPNGRFIAYNKWIDKMDHELCLYDTETKSERQLTFKSNGENNRISWVDDETILAVFCSHETGRGGWHIFSYHVPDGTITELKPINMQDGEPVHFNGVEALHKSRQLLYVRGLENEYRCSWNNKEFHNALYRCDTDATNEEKLLDSMPERTLGAIAASPEEDKVLIEAFCYPQTFGGDELSDLYLYDLQTSQCSLLETGTEGAAIEHRALCWVDNNTIAYRTQESWYCINTETKEKVQVPQVSNKYSILNILIK